MKRKKTSKLRYRGGYHLIHWRYLMQLKLLLAHRCKLKLSRWENKTSSWTKSRISSLMTFLHKKLRKVNTCWKISTLFGRSPWSMQNHRSRSHHTGGKLQEANHFQGKNSDDGRVWISLALHHDESFWQPPTTTKWLSISRIRIWLSILNLIPT